MGRVEAWRVDGLALLDARILLIDLELGEGGLGHPAASSGRSAFQTVASRSSPALTMPTLDEQVSPPSGEALPAYEAGGVSPKKDVKTPSGTIGLGVRGGV